jgi:hypothetical protein
MYRYLLSLMMLSIGSALFGAEQEKKTHYCVIRDKQNHNNFVYQGECVDDALVIAPYQTSKNPDIKYRAAVFQHVGGLCKTSELDARGKNIYEVSDLRYSYLGDYGPHRNMYSDFDTALKKMAKIAAIYGDVMVAKEKLGLDQE